MKTAKMKALKVNSLKIVNRIIALLMAALGFAASCEPRAEYGTPSARFIVKGKVTAANTEEPINNIRVVMQGDTAFSDAQGNYQVSDDYGFPTDQTYTISFQDIDGVVNGSYSNLDTVAEFIDPRFTGGDGNWFEGETSMDLNVKLDHEE